ncbi:MAG: CHAT domain-containing protein [Streptosporangiaceae bacterium]
MYNYVEFSIVVRLGREGKYDHRITVECVKPDGGQVGPTDAQSRTSSITRLLPGSNAEQRNELGEELGRCMFPPRVLAAFHETLRTLAEGTGVRIRLRCVDDELARWPWEFARIELPPRPRPRYLLRDERFSLVRSVIDDRPVDQPKQRRKLVILVVDATKVQYEDELIPDFPDKLPQTMPVQRIDLPHPTRQSIDEYIDKIADSDDPLDIFHFTGHGRPPRDGQAGALVLYRDQDTGNQHYRGDELGSRLRWAGTSLAFVNACYTDDQAATGEPGVAQSLTGIVPVVIAMRDAVADRDAKDFAEAFYQSLLSGSTVDEAVARGRAAFDESQPGWSRVVLYSRANSGRFLEPMQVAVEPVQATPERRQVSDGIRRWAMVHGLRGHWQLVPGDTGPDLRPVDPGTGADLSHLRMVNASLALSGDARVVAQLNQGRLSLAWVDRVLPRLDRWPESFELPPDVREGRLLAVAVDYGDEVQCLLSTDLATYRADVRPRYEPVLTKVFDTPTRCAAILAGRTLTVDNDGRPRGWELDVRTHGIAEVSSFDAARSAGRAVYALAGRDMDGEPIVAEGSSTGSLAPRFGSPAEEIVVVRPLSGTQAPDQLLLTTGEHIERVAAGGAS